MAKQIGNQRNHVGPESLTWTNGQCAIHLCNAHETAWDPTSTSRVISGPAVVHYTRHPDGGVDARVER